MKKKWLLVKRKQKRSCLLYICFCLTLTALKFTSITSKNDEIDLEKPTVNMLFLLPVLITSWNYIVKRCVRVKLSKYLYFYNTISMSAFYVLLWTVHLEIFQISYSTLSKNYIVHVNCKTAEKHYHFDNCSRKPTKVMHQKQTHILWFIR